MVSIQCLLFCDCMADFHIFKHFTISFLSLSLTLSLRVCVGVRAFCMRHVVKPRVIFCDTKSRLMTLFLNKSRNNMSHTNKCSVSIWTVCLWWIVPRVIHIATILCKSMSNRCRNVQSSIAIIFISFDKTFSQLKRE